MKQLILLRGLSVELKEELILKYNIEHDVINLKDLKKLLSITRFGYSNQKATLEYERHSETSAYRLLNKIIREKMDVGATCIVNAEFISDSDIKPLFELSQEFGYELSILPFECSFGKLQSDNALLEITDRIPLGKIEENYIRYITEGDKLKSTYNYITEEEFAKKLEYKLDDLNFVERIRIIGDIHSSATALEKMINSAGGSHFIFLGDYLDRGTDPLKTLYLLESIYDRSEFLYGNHEVYFEKILHIFEKYDRSLGMDKLISKEDLSDDSIVTFKKLYNSKVDFSELARIMRKIYDKLIYYKYFKYNKKLYFLSHGGVSVDIIEAKNAGLFPRSLFMKGVGKYLTNIDKIYENDNHGVIQLHGHRNKFDISLEDTIYSKNLEGAVESIGAMRVVELNKGKEDTNILFKEDYRAYEPDETSTEMQVFYMECKKSKNIMVRPRKTRHIYSFNFREDIYRPVNWSQVKYKADGIFANINKNEVVARGFNKAFDDYDIAGVHIDNRWVRVEAIAKAISSHMSYPLQVTRKYNGYKGYLGYNLEKDALFFASKLGDDTLESDRFEEIFLSLYKDRLGELRELLRSGVCLLFEVLEPNNISNYLDIREPAIVLVGIFERELKENVKDYAYTKGVAEHFGFNMVKYHPSILNEEELKKFLINTYKTKSLKGYVLRDCEGQIVKVKTDQQLILKRIFIALRRAANDNFSSVDGYKEGSIERDFLEYILNNLTREERFDTLKNIIVYARDFFEARDFEFSDDNSLAMRL